jgi:uncharacterized membrane-anchored protein YjiN (DUF445 family)
MYKYDPHLNLEIQQAIARHTARLVEDLLEKMPDLKVTSLHDSIVVERVEKCPWYKRLTKRIFG